MSGADKNYSLGGRYVQGRQAGNKWIVRTCSRGMSRKPATIVATTDDGALVD
jgi:hypothetical protein